MVKSIRTYAPAHARIYDSWRPLPAWRCLSCAARALLLEFMCDYRPTLGNNGRLQMSVRRAAEAINVGKDTATKALVELEIAGWITVEKVGGFGRRNRPSEFALTMFANDETAMPASFAFKTFELEQPTPRARRTSVRLQGHGGADLRTRPPAYKDTKPKKGEAVQLSDALRNSLAFKGLKQAGGLG